MKTLLPLSSQKSIFLFSLVQRNSYSICPPVKKYEFKFCEIHCQSSNSPVHQWDFEPLVAYQWDSIHKVSAKNFRQIALRVLEVSCGQLKEFAEFLFIYTKQKNGLEPEKQHCHKMQYVSHPLLVIGEGCIVGKIRRMEDN